MPRGLGLFCRGYLVLSPPPAAVVVLNSRQAHSDGYICLQQHCKQTRGCFNETQHRCIPVEGRRLSRFPSPSLGSRFHVVLVCFRTEWCNATSARGEKGNEKGGKINACLPAVWNHMRSREYRMCARVFVLRRKQQGKVCTTCNMLQASAWWSYEQTGDRDTACSQALMHSLLTLN